MYKIKELIEILTQFENGKKIRKKSWTEGWYIKKTQDKIFDEKETLVNGFIINYPCDIWELYQEPQKKYKLKPLEWYPDTGQLEACTFWNETFYIKPFFDGECKEPNDYHLSFKLNSGNCCIDDGYFDCLEEAKDAAQDYYTTKDIQQKIEELHSYKNNIDYYFKNSDFLEFWYIKIKIMNIIDIRDWKGNKPSKIGFSTKKVAQEYFSKYVDYVIDKYCEVVE